METGNETYEATLVHTIELLRCAFQAYRSCVSTIIQSTPNGRQERISGLKP